MGGVLRRQLALHRAVGRVLGVVRRPIDVRSPWSLAIEEQFYLVWPLAVVAIWRWSHRPVRTLAVICGGAIGLSFVAMVLLYDGVEPTRVYMGTDTRAASLLVGALAATDPARRLARRVVVGARWAAWCGVGGACRAGRVVVGGGRWCEFGVAVSGWSAGAFVGLCGGDLVGRGGGSGLVRARAGLAAVGVDRGAVLRAVSVALADLRRAQCGADGARRVDAARGAHRRVRRVRLHVVSAGGGPGAAPRQVGSRPLRVWSCSSPPSSAWSR